MALSKLFLLFFEHQGWRASFILTDDAFWLQLSAGRRFRADSSVKMSWRGVEIETLPFALSHHFWLFDNNNSGRERAPRGRRVMLTQVLAPLGAKSLSRRHHSFSRCSWGELRGVLSNRGSLRKWLNPYTQRFDISSRASEAVHSALPPRRSCAEQTI